MLFMLMIVLITAVAVDESAAENFAHGQYKCCVAARTERNLCVLSRYYFVILTCDI